MAAYSWPPTSCYHLGMGLDLSNWLLPVVAFAVAMSATPGPNNVMVAASGATFGFRPTVPHILGISVGFPAMVAVIALGAAEPLRTLPWLHEALRWIGAAYMLWLAWHIAVAEPVVATEDGRARAERRGRPLSFVQAALFQWVNPKAWVIAGGAVVTYLSGSGAVFYVQAAAVVAVLLVTTVVFVAMWTGIGAGAARLLRTRRAVRRFNVAMAGLLVLSLIPMVLE
jgi:threonine/homoserine/homoserine lactone efflux protein